MMTAVFRRNRLYGVIAILLMTVSGCSSVYPLLSAEQKRDVYERVSEDVKTHVERGHFLRSSGYPYRALNEYQRARFYGDLAPVSAETLELLKKRIHREAPVLYQQGKQAADNRQYTRALKKFNALMRLNPDYKDGADLYYRMLNKRRNTDLIDELAEQLRTVIDSQTPDRDTDIERLSNEILSYQYDHPLAYAQHMREFDRYIRERKQGMAEVRKGYRALDNGHFDVAEEHFRHARALKATAKEGVSGLYRLQKRKDAIYLTKLASNSLERGDMAEAEERAMRAVEADKAYAPATLLLKKIVRQRLTAESQSLTGQARALIKQGEYLEAMQLMDEVLRKQQDHKEARALRNQARARLQASVADYTELGSLLFNQSRYQEAIRYFEAVLAVEPDNHIARTYLKRIELRRRTLQMFE